MFQTLATRRRRSHSRSDRRSKQQRKTVRSRRLALESLETREMLSAAPMTFQVVDDAAANIAFRYAANGTPQGSSSLAAANAAPRGVASMIGIDKAWVIDANRNAYVYNASGGLLGSWSAGSMANNATPEGIATDGTNIWIVDAKSDKVFYYAGAANRLSGSQNAASSFSLVSANANPKDIVSDGAALWVVDDTAKTDKVFKYSTTGGVLGNWTIDAANKTPAGIAIDPANIADIWISDSGTDRVYRYAGAAGHNSGSQAATASYALASGNGNAQGLVVAGRPWGETPYSVQWVRQFGSPGDDGVRGVTADGFGNIYLSGGTTGSLAGPNANPYLAQYDTNGNQNWIQQGTSIAGVEYGGVRVVTDSQGNIFQVVNVVSESFASSLRSYDPPGALRWETPLPVGEGMFDVTVDANGFAYTSSYEGNNVHIRKFDGTTGTIIWQVDLNTGGATNTSGVSADQMGNIYVTAYTSGALLGPNTGRYDALVAKISEAGSVLWTRQYGSAGSDLAFYAGADAFGNVYSGGRTDGTPGSPNAGGLDVFLAKHDGAGNLLWTRQYGTSGDDVRADMWIDASGNVYRAIETTGSLGGAHLGGYDIVVAKFDPIGNMLWATQVGTSGDDDASGGIWGDDQGNLYVTGRTTGSWGGPNAGSGDAFVIKLSPPASSANGSAVTTLAATADSSTSTSSPSSSLALCLNSAGAVSTNSKPAAVQTKTGNARTSALDAILAHFAHATANRKNGSLPGLFVDDALAGWNADKNHCDIKFSDSAANSDAAFDAALDTAFVGVF